MQLGFSHILLMVYAQTHGWPAAEICLVISLGQDNKDYSNNYGEFSNQPSVDCTFGLSFKTFSRYST